MQSPTGFRSKIFFAFGLALLMVAGLSFVTLQVAREAGQAAQEVARTQSVLQGLAYARSATLQIELSTQSFRVSGDATHIDVRNDSIARREQSLEQVRTLTAADPVQQARWTELRAVISQRMAISNHIEALLKSQGRTAADAFVTAAPLKETRERVYRLIDAMEDEERGRLQKHTAQGRTREHLLYTAGGAVLALWLTMLAATFALIRRQLARSETSGRQLADSEERLAITLRSIADGVLATDVEGHITRINPAAERITGWLTADAVGQQVDHVLRLVAETDRRPLPSPLHAVLDTGETQHLDRGVLVLSRDGRECHVALSATPKGHGNGHVRGMVVVFRDVTMERQAQLSIEAQNRQLAERVEERTLQWRQSEAHLSSVANNVPAMIAYVDAQARYVYVNEQYRARFAPEREDIAGCTVREILGERRYSLASPLIDRVLQGEPQTYDWQPFPGVWQVVNYVPQRTADGCVVGYYVLGSDITERKHYEERVEALNRELAQRVHELERTTRALQTLSAGNRAMLRASAETELLDSMCEAVMTGGYGLAIVWYRQIDNFGTLTPVAERGYPGGLAALRLLRLSWREGEFSAGAAGQAIREDKIMVVGDMAADPAYVQWRQHLVGHRSAIACPLRIGGEVVGVLSIYDPEPEVFDVNEVALLIESADDLAFGIATLRSHAEQKRDREALYQLTHYDALTGLPSALRFTESLCKAIETGGPFAVLQVNVDRLREVNDALGFSQGDQLLREFGSRLQGTAPQEALVARLRGDEFAILVPRSGRDVALALAHQVGDALSAPFEVADIPLDVSSKIGLALFPDHGVTVHDLFRRMDIAVQQARQRGLRQTVFDPIGGADQPGRLSQASALRRAIEGKQLRLYLQPKVDMANGKVCGAEALVRWQHPERGMVSPLEFIELAEHTGLIKPLTEWMLATVLRQNQAWVIEGCALPIAVNLSARNLRDADLPDRITQMLAEFGVNSNLLELEITESTVMEDAEFALGVLRSLRDKGIALHVDDFGTGYSSLSYLQRLPVQYIKIDQSFVRGMGRSKDCATIVRSTIDLVHDLGKYIIAEGIELQEQWTELSRLGCDVGQGYFIARPMPAAEFQAWLGRYTVPSQERG